MRVLPVWKGAEIMEQKRQDNYEVIEFNLSAHGQAHFEVSTVTSSYVAPHWHDSVEIISLLEGSLMVHVDRQEYHMRAGDCIILNPYTIHSTVSPGSNQALLLQIPVDAFRDCTGPVSDRQIICDPFTADPAKRRALERIREMLRQIRDAEQSGEPAGRLRSVSLLLEIMYLLLTELSRPIPGFTIQNERKNRERLSAAIAYTVDHYAEPVTLEDVAGALHLQVNYFCHFFKKHTGMTYLQYLNEYRLAKVYRDLVVTDIPLKRLLERHGFTNYKLFRRMFAQRFDKTPGELRRG